VITEPFRRIAIDVVGPLPVCQNTGHRFILSVIDHCTNFPEAIFRAHTSVLRSFGFPSEILSDCGTEFMSKLMKILLSEFGIDHIRTSPYHPGTNGSC